MSKSNISYISRLPQYATVEEVQKELENLELLSKDSIAKGDYKEAGNIEKKLIATKKLLKDTIERELKDRHLAESVNLRTDQEAEMVALNEKYDQKLKEFQAKSEKLTSDLEAKHKNEIEKIYQKINLEAEKVKPSATYLMYESQEAGLVKLRNFEEAAVAKRNKDLQRQKDIQRATANMEKELKAEENKVKTKQMNEINHLKTKLQAEFDALKKMKNQEISVLEKKYNTKLHELNKQQKFESVLNKNEGLAKKVNSSTLTDENRVSAKKYNKYAPNFKDMDSGKKTKTTVIDLETLKSNKNPNGVEDFKERKYQINFNEVPFEI